MRKRFVVNLTFGMIPISEIRSGYIPVNGKSLTISKEIIVVNLLIYSLYLLSPISPLTGTEPGFT